MAVGPGGGWKTNVLKTALEKMMSKHGDDGEARNALVMFTDSYDVIFTGTAEEIIQRYDDSGATVLFGAEDFCWPDKSLKSSYPPAPIENGLRFLNSGGFIGPAWALHDLLESGGRIEDKDDDQLYYTHLYLREATREKFGMKLDHTASLFQNMNGERDNIAIEFPASDEDDEGVEDGTELEPYVLNKVHSTRPLVIHGNGPSKNHLLVMGNYLAKSWSTKTKSCISCFEDALELDPSESLPIIVMGVFVTDRTPDMQGFWNGILDLSYDKHRIDLVVFNAIAAHGGSVYAHIIRNGKRYRSVKTLSAQEHDEPSARNAVLSQCSSDSDCGYVFFVDSDTRLTNSDTLQTLASYNRPIVAPLLTRKDGWHSNFWGSISGSWHQPAFDHDEIVYRERRGLWNVPFARSAMLISATGALRNRKARPSYGTGWFADADMDFMASVRNGGEIFVYVSNLEEFGHLVEYLPEEDRAEADEKVPGPLPSPGSWTEDRSEAGPVSTGTPQQMKRSPRTVATPSAVPESSVANAVDGGRRRRELAILTVATDRTAGYVRFERSCRAYGLSCIPLGMGTEWRGGDMANGPGGGWKTNLLRDALDEMLSDEDDSAGGDDGDALVMFTDSYDVILTGTAEDILQRYDDSGATVLFGAEDFCWPDKSLKSSYPPPPIENGLKFLNSGGFVGPASTLRAILDAGGDIQDGDDDQLYYTLIYLNAVLRERFNIKLDHAASLFQNLNGQYDDVKIVFPPVLEGKDAPKLQEPYLLNKVHNTRPLVVHGNGPSKKHLLGLGNYLAKSWSVNGNSCLACSEDVLELDPSQPLPKIVMGIFVTERTRDMKGFWRNVTNLSYDKGSIDVVLYNQVPDHTQSMSRFLSRHGAEYDSVTVLSSKSVATIAAGALHDERSARAFVVSRCESDPSCDYVFVVDADARLTDTFVIQTLIRHNRPIVAPLLVRRGWMFSNYWGALSPSGWYESAFDYGAIIYKERRGIWNAPFVRSAMLMNATSVIRNPKARPMYDLGRWEDVDMDFMQDVRDKGGVFAYVSNAAEFGYLVEELKEGDEEKGEDPEEDEDDVQKPLSFDASGSVLKETAAPMNAEECVPNQTCEEQETNLPINKEDVTG